MNWLEAFEHVGDVFPEAMLLVSNDGVVRAANAACVGVFPRHPVAGRRIFDLVDTPKADLSAYLALCARSRQLVMGAVRVASRDGGSVTFRAEGAVFGAADVAERLVLMRLRPQAAATSRFVELTERIAELQGEVLRRRAAEAAAEASARLKDQFLATISHELRTPLNAILGWCRMLRIGNLDEARTTHAFETIERNAQMQALLIEDLLDISRIAAGKLRIQQHDVSISDVIDRAVEAVRPAADNRQVTLALEVDSSAPLRVVGDAARLQQVVWNLLTNAVKFTSGGGRVTLAATRDGTDVVITVTDTGAGFAPELRAELFRPFRQGDASTTRAHGGLGLGLAISRQLVEAHGGSVDASSRGIGQGATFVVRLPAATARVGTSTPDRHALPPLTAGNLSGVVALVVEDDRDARDLLVTVLEQCGARALQAGSVAEALAILEHEQPDVLLADIGMPRQDGYELVRTVRRIEAITSRHIPAIAVTAYASVRDREEAIAAGFDAHVAKPADPAALVTVIAGIFGRPASEPRI